MKWPSFSILEKKSEAGSKDFLRFYEISGQDKITEHGLNRYKKDKKQDALIKEQAEKKFDFLTKIKGKSKGEIVSIFKSELKDNPNIRVEKELIEKIVEWVPEKERAEFIKLGLENPREGVQMAAIRFISEAAKEDKFQLVKLGLESKNLEVQNLAAQMILLVPEESRVFLENIVLENIGRGLASSDPGTQMTAIGMMTWVPRKETFSIIKSILESSSFIAKIKMEAGLFIDEFSEKDQDLLREILFKVIEEGLNNPDLETQTEAAGMISEAQNEKWIFLENLLTENIKKQLTNLEGLSIEDQCRVVRMIRRAPDEARAELIKLGLTNQNIEVQKAAAEMIFYEHSIEGEHFLRSIVLENIKKGLANPDIEIQKTSIEMICYAPESEQVSLFKFGLEHSNIKIRRAFIDIINNIIYEIRGELFNLIMEKGLGEELIKPPLYKDKEINNRSFSRQKFEKTGSETTLLGGELKDKTIIRHIEPDAFLTWQKAYEDYNLWQKNGFDYVPIEPILSYKLNKDGLVDVFSGVLDLSLGNWEEIVGKLGEEELEEQRKKILDVLENQFKIKHSHTHYGNFCLRFFRDKNGQPDFKRTPRLYLIDFDAAVSPGVDLDKKI